MPKITNISTDFTNGVVSATKVTFEDGSEQSITTESAENEVPAVVAPVEVTIEITPGATPTATVVTAANKA